MVSHRNIKVRAPCFVGGGDSPYVAQRLDQEFLEGLLRDIGRDDRTWLLEGQAPVPDAGGTWKLFQPVHRVFNLALVEVTCGDACASRLDPLAIESAGMVVRRLHPDLWEGELPDRNGGTIQRWLRHGPSIRGWVSAEEDERTIDPDPKRRKVPRANDPEIDRRLQAKRRITDLMAETTIPMFVSPPETCTAARSTVLYGVLDVASSEVAEAPPRGVIPGDPVGLFDYDEDEVGRHLGQWLRPGSRPRPVPLPGRWVTGWRRPSQVPREGHGEPDLLTLDAPGPELHAYVLFLQQLTVELDVFGTTTEAEALRGVLNGIRLSLPGNRSVPALEHVRRAMDVLVDRRQLGVEMPLSWPALDDRSAGAITTAATRALKRRADLVKPPERRFGSDGYYQVRAFVRVKEPHCPPRIHWTEPSPWFRIAAWHEAGPQPRPLAQIDLPDPFDRDALSKLVPNVAFKVPKKLFNFLRDNSPAGMLKGEATEGGAGELYWVCGFNIPIITLCAFILLFVILFLLNIVFWWLPFVKICIPIPIPKRSGS